MFSFMIISVDGYHADPRQALDWETIDEELSPARRRVGRTHVAQRRAAQRDFASELPRGFVGDEQIRG